MCKVVDIFVTATFLLPTDFCQKTFVLNNLKIMIRRAEKKYNVPNLKLEMFSFPTNYNVSMHQRGLLNFLTRPFMELPHR